MATMMSRFDKHPSIISCNNSFSPVILSSMSSSPVLGIGKRTQRTVGVAHAELEPFTDLAGVVKEGLKLLLAADIVKERPTQGGAASASNATMTKDCGCLSQMATDM